MSSSFTQEETKAILALKQCIRSLLLTPLNLAAKNPELNYKDIVIAGGCFASILNKTDVHDYDFFLLNTTEAQKTTFDNTVLKKGDTSYMKNKKIISTHLNSNNKVQWILTSYKTKEELLNGFDMQHCRVCYIPYEDALYISPATFHCIINKTLRSNGKNITEHWRIGKFIAKGWTNEIVSV